MSTVDTVRRFNRFYTKTIGVLPEQHLNSEHSLAEVRVMYELAQREAPAAAELGSDLALDAGYLSRILRRLEERGLVTRKTSPDDARRSHLKLTKKGRTRFDTLDARARETISAILQPLSRTDRRRVEEAMQTIEQILGGAASEKRRGAVVIRPHRSGDLGWVVQRHGALYFEEYGWDERFEALVARIVADFVEHLDAKREHCWIAELDGKNAGSVFLVKKTATVAKLRLLLVEPHARGHGIGSRLVDECTRFARQAGYKKIVLWTQSVLHDARRIYERAGYRIAGREKHDSFGAEGLIAETWELKL